ncbi:MAG: metallophosphoesterase family protein [Streptosporangiaceae bacterium]
MRAAVLSDIHGHLPALEAVLRDVDAVGADVIVLNGDIAEGPLPAETLDLLASLGDRAVWVRGNGDRWAVDAYDGRYEPTGGPADASVEWTAARISQEHRDRLAALPLTVRLDVDGLGAVLFCHATPRNDTEIVLVDSPMARYEEVFGGIDESTVVVGHTHMPFDRLADRRRIVNPGSVGMPYGGTGAYWALIGPDVTLRHTAYDLEAAGERLHRGGMPDIEPFVEENVRTAPSDAEALSVFSGRAP